jgi:hypothetical protein
MWSKAAEHSGCGISATSWQSEQAVIEDTFSVGLFFSSYESRCLESSTAIRSKGIEKSVIVCFREKDPTGLREKHDKALFQQVSECTSERPEVIDSFSVQEVELVLEEIMRRIPVSAASGECKWFMDITGSPKPYYMGLLGWLRNRVESPLLTLFHTEARYEEKHSPDEAFCFTEGFSRYIWVPRLWGQPDPRLPWTYMFLLGFEGDRSLEIYERFEPEYTVALISDPGYQPGYTEIAKDRNRVFLTEAKPEIFYTNAADPIGTWSELERRITKTQAKSNVCIVPLGTKPHALGGCLAALAARTPAVLYLMPRSYKARDVPRGKSLWKYEISL